MDGKQHAMAVVIAACEFRDAMRTENYETQSAASRTLIFKVDEMCKQAIAELLTEWRAAVGRASSLALRIVLPVGRRAGVDADCSSASEVTGPRLERAQERRTELPRAGFQSGGARQGATRTACDEGSRLRRFRSRRRARRLQRSSVPQPQGRRRLLVRSRQQLADASRTQQVQRPQGRLRDDRQDPARAVEAHRAVVAASDRYGIIHVSTAAAAAIAITIIAIVQVLSSRRVNVSALSL